MTINKHETILNVYDNDDALIRTNTANMYFIYPAEGKLLRNIYTGFTTDKYVALTSKDKISNYEEIDKE